MSLYEEIGIRPFINARAPYTRFGGAIMPDEVTRAMVEASCLGVHMAELHEKVGQAIATLTRNEVAYEPGSRNHPANSPGWRVIKS